jgi:hypothetical protein
MKPSSVSCVVTLSLSARHSLVRDEVNGLSNRVQILYKLVLNKLFKSTPASYSDWILPNIDLNEGFHSSRKPMIFKPICCSFAWQAQLCTWLGCAALRLSKLFQRWSRLFQTQELTPLCEGLISRPHLSTGDRIAYNHSIYSIRIRKLCTARKHL